MRSSRREIRIFTPSSPSSATTLADNYARVRLNLRGAKTRIRELLATLHHLYAIAKYSLDLSVASVTGVACEIR